MKNLFLTLFIMSLTSTSSGAKKFYAVGFFCTNDHINTVITRTGAVADSSEFIRFSKSVASAINYDLQLNCFSGKEFTPESAGNYEQALRLDTDDIVLIYFDTHGFRLNGQKSSFPRAYLNNYPVPDLAGSSIDFKSYCQKFIDLKPKLVVGLIDACNKDEITTRQDALTDVGLLSVADAANIDNMGGEVEFGFYKNLFLDVEGSVLIASSSIGEDSCVDEYGAQFSINFFNSITDYQTNTNVSWKSLLASASKKTTEFAKKVAKIVQTPQFFVNIDPVKTPDLKKYKGSVSYNEFEKAEKEGRYLFRKGRFGVAIGFFRLAFEHNRADPMLKLQIFFCEVELKKEAFSTVDIKNLCGLLVKPEVFGYVRQERFGPIQYYIGMSLIKGQNGCKKNYHEGVKWLGISGSNGFPPGQERYWYYTR